MIDFIESFLEVKKYSEIDVTLINFTFYYQELLFGNDLKFWVTVANLEI